MKLMARLAGAVAFCAVFGLGTAMYARNHIREEPLDPSKGAKLTSRIPCDGATNPQDLLNLAATFSKGDGERAFRIEVFEANYCKRGDLGFACVQPGHSLWKQEWTVVSSSASSNPVAGSYGLDSCAAWGSKETPQYVLSGWYREGGADSKMPWKQVAVTKVASRWETYEFADPSGETGRLEINRW
jgi:hypothetical protein